MKKLVVLFIFLISSLGYAQPGTTDHKVLGFICGYSGSSTRVVNYFATLLYQKNYPVIRSHLNSEIPAEKFIALVICKRLDHLKEIQLTESELKSIAILHHSKELISWCNGCTDRQEIAISELLKSKTKVMETLVYYFDP